MSQNRQPDQPIKQNHSNWKLLLPAALFILSGFLINQVGDWLDYNSKRRECESIMKKEDPFFSYMDDKLTKCTLINTRKMNTKFYEFEKATMKTLFQIEKDIEEVRKIQRRAIDHLVVKEDKKLKKDLRALIKKFIHYRSLATHDQDTITNLENLIKDLKEIQKYIER